MSNIAIITARGGSKRIPGKNIKAFRGKPIIAYSIEVAQKSGLFDMIMVSTDDPQIAEVAKQYGASVPFFRSHSTADDFSTTAEVMIEVFNELKVRRQFYQFACCIYPTAPFISTENLQSGYRRLTEQKHITVFPVSRFSYSIYRALKINDSGKVEMVWPENLNSRSQDLPAAFHDAGQFYWMDVDKFLKEQKLFTSDSGTIVLSDMEVQDIDTDLDWKMAELKHTLLYP